MATMKIQDGALVTSQLRYDSSNRFISQHLISGVSFTSISFIVFKKWRGGIWCPSPVQGRPKKPSLNIGLSILRSHEVDLFVSWGPRAPPPPAYGPAFNNTCSAASYTVQSWICAVISIHNPFSKRCIGPVIHVHVSVLTCWPESHRSRHKYKKLHQAHLYRM